MFVFLFSVFNPFPGLTRLGGQTGRFISYFRFFGGHIREMLVFCYDLGVVSLSCPLLFKNIDNSETMFFIFNFLLTHPISRPVKLVKAPFRCSAEGRRQLLMRNFDKHKCPCSVREFLRLGLARLLLSSSRQSCEPFLNNILKRFCNLENHQKL